jgi:hypothetical protein
VLGGGCVVLNAVVGMLLLFLRKRRPHKPGYKWIVTGEDGPCWASVGKRESSRGDKQKSLVGHYILMVGSKRGTFSKMGFVDVKKVLLQAR